MKVCLIYPQASFFGYNSLGKHPESIYINHGVASISAVLKQAGIEVEFFDTRDHGDKKQVMAELGRIEADVYLISTTSVVYPEAREIGQFLRQRGKRTIIGGIHASVMPEDVEKDFDVTFIGEAEADIVEVVKSKLRPGWSRWLGRIPDLNTLPYEDRSIFDPKKTMCARHSFYEGPVVTVISGRGCPYRCSFCQPAEQKVFGKRFRKRSVDHLMGEIEQLYDKYHFETLLIDDDLFFLPPLDYLEEFAARYKKIGKKFVIQCRADLICKYPDHFKKLKDAGMYMVIIGFESGSQRILDLLKKDTTVKQNLEAAKICEQMGVKVWANYILGIPTETSDEMRQTINMIEQMKPFHPSMSLFTPTPGCELYDYCVKHDLLIDKYIHRGPGSAKIKGIDYQLINQIRGRF